MNDINNLVYFLNSLKNVLPFDDEKDFNRKINENKDFRIKVQKLVYLSKFFGWDNPYIFTLNIHGPYSVNLAEIYDDKNLFDEDALEIDDFNFKTFLNFVEEKSNDFLEAASTMLYLFKNKKYSFNEDNCISALNDLKPDISYETKITAFNNVDELGLINKLDHTVHTNEINHLKSALNLKIKGIQETVEPMDICHNHTLILGSLEYMAVVMKIEDIEHSFKKDLLEFISFYVSRVEDALNDSDNFINHDLTIIEKLFNQFQNYVSGELNILPRVDDDDFDYADYY